MCPRKEGGKEIMKYVVLVSHGEFANGLKDVYKRQMQVLMLMVWETKTMMEL